MSGYAVGHVLRTSHFSGTSLLVLIVIAEATHQDGTGAWPSIGSIAQLARTSDRNVSRVLRDLEAAGELRIERGAGPHGTHLYTVPGVGQLRLGDDTHVTPDNTSPRRRRHQGGDTHVTRGVTELRHQGGDTAVSPKPSVPALEPSMNLSRAARAPAIEIPTRMPTERQIAREQHRFGKEAERVWLQVTAKVGSPYTDRAALRIVHEHALAATRWATETQILTAIRRHMDAKSSPRRIPEWARLEVGEAEEREHRDREMAERAATDARLRDEPVDPAVLEQLKAATRSMRMAGAPS